MMSLSIRLLLHSFVPYILNEANELKDKLYLTHPVRTSPELGSDAFSLASNLSYSDRGNIPFGETSDSTMIGTDVEVTSLKSSSSISTPKHTLNYSRALIERLKEENEVLIARICSFKKIISQIQNGTTRDKRLLHHQQISGNRSANHALWQRYANAINESQSLLAKLSKENETLVTEKERANTLELFERNQRLISRLKYEIFTNPAKKRNTSATKSASEKNRSYFPVIFGVTVVMTILTLVIVLGVLYELPGS